MTEPSLRSTVTAKAASPARVTFSTEVTLPLVAARTMDWASAREMVVVVAAVDVVAAIVAGADFPSALGFALEVLGAVAVRVGSSGSGAGVKESSAPGSVDTDCAVRTGKSETGSEATDACRMEIPATTVAAKMPVVAATVAIVRFLFIT